MDLRTQEVLAAWVVAVVVGCLHYAEVSGYNCVYQGLSVAEQKEAFLKTENAFYFSYYDDFVEAPTLGEAIWRMLRDDRSEAPDVINAVHRFNIYQEVICGFLFRCTPYWILGGLDSWFFFRGCSYVLQGLGHVALLRLAAAVGGALSIRMSHAKKCTTTTGLPPRSSSAFGGKEVWHSSGSGLIIVNVENSYAVRNWNKENPHLPIEVGQAILEVNGIRNSKRMLEEFRVTGQADLLIATELTQLSCVCGAITIFIPLASKHGWSFTAAGVLCAMQLR